jgi:hypothetical protein
MDPYLERPDLWPDVHNSLVAAVSDALSPLVRPRYVVALEERTYIDQGAEVVLVGRPDAAVVETGTGSSVRAGITARAAAAAVLEVEVPGGQGRETFLEVRAAADGEGVTVIEVPSPSNKRPGEGRNDYLRKRGSILSSLTSLVEIDLLRAGERMPLLQPWPDAGYGILVSRGWKRPRAHLLAFSLRDAMPSFPVPLREKEDEPIVELGALWHALYDRASYDLRVDYRGEADPPLAPVDRDWAQGRIAAAPRG